MIRVGGQRCHVKVIVMADLLRVESENEYVDMNEMGAVTSLQAHIPLLVHHDLRLPSMLNINAEPKLGEGKGM